MKRPEHVRRQFFDAQDRRCPVCDMEIEYGSRWLWDKVSELVLCGKCFHLCDSLRWYAGPTLDRAIKLVMDGDDCIDYTSRPIKIPLIEGKYLKIRVINP